MESVSTLAFSCSKQNLGLLFLTLHPICQETLMTLSSEYIQNRISFH